MGKRVSARAPRLHFTSTGVRLDLSFWKMAQKRRGALTSGWPPSVKNLLDAFADREIQRVFELVVHARRPRS